MFLIETKIDKKIKLAAAREALLFYVKVMIFVAVAIAAAGVIILISKLDMTIGIALIVAGFCVPAFILGLSYLSIKSKMSKESDENAAVQSVEFGEKIILNEKSATLSANNELDYALIIKAKENKDYFVLFLNAFSVIIVDKNGFKEGDEAGLRDLLTTKLGKKFR